MYQYQIITLDENLLQSNGPLLFDANEVLTFLKSQPRGEMGEIQVWIIDEIYAGELHDEDDWSDDRRPDFKITYVVNSHNVRLTVKSDLIGFNNSAEEEPLIRIIANDGIKLSRTYQVAIIK